MPTQIMIVISDIACHIFAEKKDLVTQNIGKTRRALGKCRDLHQGNMDTGTDLIQIHDSDMDRHQNVMIHFLS